MKHAAVLSVILWAACSLQVSAAEKQSLDTTRGDRMIAEYFRVETARLRDACLNDIDSLEEWNKRREEYRRQLREMLGLDPLPPRTDLHPTITGRAEHPEFVVENVQFQSSPGLYVTGNLYLPRNADTRLPTILYVCGHGAVKKEGVSYGNKVSYQHHGAWFARHGYVCLTIDTLQLGEIEGIHHGTYRYGMWWWLNRGYTPAGVEAWNCMRALDYLETRSEVDPQRFGVTGRSGGGAYSWWIAALDDRIQVAVPVAGITDLQNHVVDGCVEGHCDCMYFLNTYRWDYPLLAALVAPRPLLIGNTDSDGIFPLDGVVRTFEKARGIYRLHKAADKIGVAITSGPHKDTQELQVPAFRWFNRHLKNDESLLREPAEKFFEPEQLRVFQALPEDQKNTAIQETFVAAAGCACRSCQRNRVERNVWALRESLDQKTFAAWPSEPDSLQLTPVVSAGEQDICFKAWDFTSQGPVRLRVYLAMMKEATPKRIVLTVADEAAWDRFLRAFRLPFEKELQDEPLPEADAQHWELVKNWLAAEGAALAVVAPRGIGPTAWDQSDKKQIQHRRRFYLLGQTLDGMRVWDVRRAVQALQSAEINPSQAPIQIASEGTMGGVCLYAALYEPAVAALRLSKLPKSHREGPYLLNVERFLNLPQTLAMVLDQAAVTLEQANAGDWKYAADVSAALGRDPSRLQFPTLIQVLFTPL